MTANLPVVFTADLDMVVDLLVIFLRDEVLVSESVLCPGREVGRVLHHIAWAIHVVVPSHDTHGHVVQSPLRDCAVEDSNCEVRAPVCVTRVECSVTGHGHVETSQS